MSVSLARTYYIKCSAELCSAPLERMRNERYNDVLDKRIHRYDGNFT